MVKIASILVAFLLLFQSLNIHFDDIAELDELIEHAQFHANEHGDNFFVFISKHYGELKKDHEQQHQEEKEEHERLPFQHQSPTFFSPVFVLCQNGLNTDFVEEINYPAANYHYFMTYHSLYQDRPFQPPRQA